MNRRLLVLIAAVVAALAGFAALGALTGGGEDDDEAALRALGAPAAEACRPVTDLPASGGSDHRAGTIEYERTPPNSGPHAARWATVPRRVLTVDDAVPVEQVVHNLEHGYVVVWYDPRTADVRELAEVLGAAEQRKLFAAPWPRAPLPAPYVITAWGHEQQCSAVSGAAIADFAREHGGTNGDAPEATAP